MSKISKKRSPDTLHKNAASLWNKRYKIAFGVAVALVSLMALGAFVRSRTKEVGDKAKETIDGTLKRKPEELIDSAVDKLLGLVGKKATKNIDGTYKFEETTPDKRIDEISKGFAKVISDGASTSANYLTDKLAKYVNGELAASRAGGGSQTKFGALVAGLMSIPENKVKELWKQLDKSITGNGDEKDIKTSLTNIFSSIRDSAKPSTTELSNKIALSAGLGLKEVMPGIGTGGTMGELSLESHVASGTIDDDVLTTLNNSGFSSEEKKAIGLFIKSVSLCSTRFVGGSRGNFVSRRSALVLMLQKGLKLVINPLDKTISISKGNNKFTTRIGDSIEYAQMDELNDYIRAFGFGKIRKRSKKRSKKRSIKKNKKY